MAETAVAKAQPSQKAVAVKNFQAVMNNSYYQTLLQNTMKENKGAFTTSLMELFTSDPQLIQCDPNALMSEAVKAAGLRLPINKQLGQAYIVVFNNKDKKTGQIIPTPTLIIGTKGYINLALRTNKYANINKGTVYEGELQGFDKVTGALDISGERLPMRQLDISHISSRSLASRRLCTCLLMRYVSLLRPTLQPSSTQKLHGRN